MALKTRTELLAMLRTCTDNMGASYTNTDKANRIKMYRVALATFDKLALDFVDTRKDFSLGQIYEGLHGTALKGGYCTYARANNPDFMQGRIEVDVKVSVNSKDLATPLATPKRVHFCTVFGWVEITKKQITEIFESPEDFTEYAKVTPSGIRLKVNAYKLGKPIVALNELFGF